MSTEIIAIQNVHGYIDEHGTAWLNAEDVARGLGFTQMKNDIEYVKWERVNAYLQGFGFSPLVGRDSFIPENMFYRLAMKARNETAEKFQAKVADEILPQIRKTGSYSIQSQKLTPAFVRQLVDQWEDAERRAKENLDAKLLQDCATERNIWYDLNVASKCLNIDGMGRNNLFKFLRSSDVRVLDSENRPYQQYINQKYFMMYFDKEYNYWYVRISPNGMRFVLKQLVDYGYEPRITVEQWIKQCEAKVVTD